MRIGIIGTGTIAGAVVRGIAGDGHQITISERSTAVSAALADAFENVTIAPNQQVLVQSDVIFLGLMAGAAPDILAPLTFRADQRVISFMAGADLGQVRGMIAPARASAVMMPFPGIAQGGSAIMALGDTDLVNEIFGIRNRVFALKDSAELDAYLCAQAVLSPVARMVGDAADWLGERVADPAQGEAFLRMLVATSLADTGCADLITALNTPGGYNQRLRQHMEGAGMTDDLMSGLNDLEG
ncbi:NAD(P)-binding domain-containing protein [Phaeobacter gallaeciensis]|uniref:NAD(P)-binding domain-containing protein n=1 Tax=Phaeobacter gallaeciensis TaxID=60890 RepID=UPI00237EEEDE|nr:NAD(P)-binding domain-containing protein [Phaeobacter gallaeciensis]MDE4190799.1 NAD(P)-binding domain-containing protein [Phaeobacter gallaeciensis]MDE4197708.1 NAD(P)-binding domain-containing protein [Phaeobacter gallaeciensis]MDE4201850.1 NAD(P)-binding domain-containing protein [Phaeobacter gallaeciensis]MDE4206850.1 NAD(P)-binding domain-containing protein [Phaeobacter gallaeciensis]MDE4215218.1 NAD(P)-binding domain-containing protein [Phaeobacter gallaeciensis]